MKPTVVRERSVAIYGPAIIGALLLVTAVLIMPNQSLIGDVIRRATRAVPGDGIPTSLPPAPGAHIEERRLAGLASMFAAGDRLSTTELQDLLAASVGTADAALLVKLADRLEQAGGAEITQRTAYEILAKGRPAVALAFVDQRPDGDDPKNWRLRVELTRATGDKAGAEQLLVAAAIGASVSEKDFIEAAYELERPDLFLPAAEHGAIGRLDRKISLYLVERAVAAGRFDQVSRIDRAGTPQWRDENPWLAMTIARQAGDIQTALKYAALLPKDREQAREEIILSSGNSSAIRSLLREQAAKHPADSMAIAQRLVEAGFRPDALAVLRQQANGLPPTVPVAQRLLFLMGPRPDSANLAWLRDRAEEDSNAWLRVYVERERPRTALAFLESRSDKSIANQLMILRTATAAKDLPAANRAVRRLLEGRPLTAAQVAEATASAPSGLAQGMALGLAKARVETGLALPSDRLDLAWDAWNRNDIATANGMLQAQLKLTPDNAAALLLMANVSEKMSGKKSAQPWLERALVLTAPDSQDRLDLLERLGRNRDAIALAERLRARFPTDKKVAVSYARLLIMTGHPGQAEKVLGQ